jgi:hypothetical protein
MNLLISVLECGIPSQLAGITMCTSIPSECADINWKVYHVTARDGVLRTLKEQFCGFGVLFLYQTVNSRNSNLDPFVIIFILQPLECDAFNYINEIRISDSGCQTHLSIGWMLRMAAPIVFCKLTWIRLFTYESYFLWHLNACVVDS